MASYDYPHHSEFDAQVLVTLEDTSDPVQEAAYNFNRIDALVRTRSMPQCHISGKTLMSLFAKHRFITEMRNLGAPECLYANTVLSLEKAKTALLDSDLPAEVMEALFNQRLQVTYALNSLGGPSVIQDGFEGLAANTLTNGGHVASYALDDAASMGANAWDLGTWRATLQGSRMFWHASSHGDDRAKQIALLRERFKDVPSPWNERVAKQLDRKKNVRGEISLSGNDLANMGKAQRAFANKKDVADHIYEHTGFRLGSW